MAARPIVTTGIALVSAGVIAAVPALNPGVLSPGDQKVAASDSAVVAPPQTLSVEQLRLLALSDITLQELSDVFFQGYGGGINPIGTPPEEGGEDPYYRVAWPIFLDGFVGLSYYLTDQFLDSVAQTGIPLISDAASFAINNVTTYFYELGVWEAFRVAASELTGGPNGPVGTALGVVEQLGPGAAIALAGVVLTQATAIVPVLGPDLSYATHIFFNGATQVRPAAEENLYEEREYALGAVGVVNYVIDRILGQADPWGPSELPSEEDQNPTPPNPTDPENPDPEDPTDPETPDPEDPGDGGENGNGSESGDGTNATVVEADSTQSVRSTGANVNRFVSVNVDPDKTEDKTEEPAEDKIEDKTEEKEPGDLIDEETSEGTTDQQDGEQSSGSDAAAGESSKKLAPKPVQKTKPRLNLKRNNGPSQQTGTTTSSTSSEAGGKHRAEDKDDDSTGAASATAETGTAADSSTGKHAKKDNDE